MLRTWGLEVAVVWHGPAVAAKVRRGLVKGLVVGVSIVEAKAVSLILNTKKTGRIYKRKGTSHQASAPGEPFANDTGATLKNRRVDVNPDSLRATLTFASVNAARLEHGTRRMKPRPFARRALAETREQVKDTILGEVRKELAK